MNTKFEIDRNIGKLYSRQSFLGKLHEEAVWDEEEYFKFEKALYDLSRSMSGKSNIPRAQAWKIVAIYSYVCLLISSHFDNNDSYKIKKTKRTAIYSWRERMGLVVNGFFSGKMPKQENLEGPINTFLGTRRLTRHSTGRGKQRRAG
jgi:hypothetical protein